MIICIVEKDGQRHIVNVNESSIEFMKIQGWLVWRLGLAHSDTMLGILIDINEISPKFMANLDILRV